MWISVQILLYLILISDFRNRLCTQHWHIITVAHLHIQRIRIDIIINLELCFSPAPVCILITLILVSDGEELLIERSIHTGMINPADPWQTIRHDGPVARLIYRIRVRCDEHYYSSKCNKLCVPRDDYFGHYRCEPSGAQVCLDGWMGPDCRTGELPMPRKMVPTVIWCYPVPINPIPQCTEQP